MKKSLMVTGILTILGITWTGMSWYSGNIIEHYMTDLATSINTRIKEEWPASTITLTLQDYQRGIFSSRARYLLRAEDRALSANLPKSGNENEVVINESISHGPLPLAQLKKFNLMPQMASVQLTLDNTAAVKKLFDITDGQSPIRADSRIAYNGDTSSDIIMMPTSLHTDTLVLKFSGAMLKAQHSIRRHSLFLSGKADNLILTARNYEDKTEQLVLNNITLNSTKKSGKFGLSMGDDQLDIGQLLLNVDGRDIASLTDLQLKTQLSETDRHINGQLHYTLGALRLQGHHFGSGHLTIHVDRIDGKAAQELASVWHQAPWPLLYERKDSVLNNLFSQWDALLLSKFPAFLQSSPTISIAPLSWKNSQGESSLTLKLALTDPASGTSIPASRWHKFDFQAVKNLDIALTMPMAMLKELVTQAGLLHGHNEEEARKLAQQQVQGLAALGQLLKLTVTKDNTISSSIRYTDNQAELNGQKISLQELIDLLSPFSLSVQ